MEGLSFCLRRMENTGDIEGIKIKRDNPTIIHLLFANDCYIFIKTNIKCSKKIKTFLENFSKALGQTINYDKSKLIFSKHTPNLIRKIITNELEVKQESNSGKYLGLPSSIRNNKIKLFSYIEDNVDKKLQGWKEKLLNQAEKEIY